MTEQEGLQKLRDALVCLREHFGHVVIVGTWDENGSSMMAQSGFGNYYAQIGMVNTYIDNFKAEDAAREIAKATAPPPDDSESWKE